jgi:hypothetical protein
VAPALFGRFVLKRNIDRMPMLPPQPVAITCPNCGTKYQTPVFQLLDVGQAPELKQALLSGRVNVAICPSCSAGGMLSAPMMYHDPAKQFFFALFPQEIKASPQEQEQFVGALTQFVMRDLPQDTPKGYLLTPRRFISLTSMLDTILEGEGISKADLEAQRKRTQLLGRLLEAADDEQVLQKIVDEQREALDYEFFLTLAAYIEAAQQEQDEDSLQRFTTLRDRLTELTGMSGEPGAEAEIDVDAAVEELLSVPEAELPEAIANHRPVLDYAFYEVLAERIDQAKTAQDEAEVARLEARRDLIRTTVEQMDRDAQELFERAAQTLQTVLDAPETRAALVEHREQIDEAFMLVVSLNAQQAERSGNREMVERLAEIARLAPEVVQESLSPEERLIGELLATETPQDATKLLRQNAAKINGDFVKRINELSQEMADAGRKEIADRLRQLGREAASMLF